MPREACGLLGGRREGDAVRLYVLPVRNAARSPNIFVMTAQRLSAARATLRRRRLVLCGCFHTHPTLGPEPSWLDRRSMERFALWWLVYSRRSRRLTMIRTRAGRLERARVRMG